MTDDGDLEAIAQRLDASEDYRVIRKLQAPQFTTRSARPDEKLAVLVDVETTGLDPAKDEIIELALVRFRYSTNGEITGIVDGFNQLRQPSFSIPTIATEITGISNEMVAGCHIDHKAVKDIVLSADLVTCAPKLPPFYGRVSNNGGDYYEAITFQ